MSAPAALTPGWPTRERDAKPAPKQCPTCWYAGAVYSETVTGGAACMKCIAGFLNQRKAAGLPLPCPMKEYPS